MMAVDAGTQATTMVVVVEVASTPTTINSKHGRDKAVATPTTPPSPRKCANCVRRPATPCIVAGRDLTLFHGQEKSGVGQLLWG